MRTHRGKHFTVLAGAAAIVLLTFVAPYWKDIYCHLFLDPRLVGRWKGQVTAYPSEHVIEFGKLGEVEVVSTSNLVNPKPPFRLVRDVAGTYSIDAGSLSIVWSDGREPPTGKYEIEGDSLSLWWTAGFFVKYWRIDD